MQIVFFVFALAAAAPSLSKPLHLASRDVVLPPITNPTAGTIWRTGETEVITWDASVFQHTQPSNPVASLILGRLSADGSEGLMLDSPLATGIPIVGGNASITVPSVPSGDNYIVCLYGTSGDISSTFKIVGADSSN